MLASLWNILPLAITRARTNILLRHNADGPFSRHEITSQPSRRSDDAVLFQYGVDLCPEILQELSRTFECIGHRPCPPVPMVVFSLRRTLLYRLRLLGLSHARCRSPSHAVRGFVQCQAVLDPVRDVRTDGDLSPWQVRLVPPQRRTNEIVLGKCYFGGYGAASGAGVRHHTNPLGKPFAINSCAT